MHPRTLPVKVVIKRITYTTVAAMKTANNVSMSEHFMFTIPKNESINESKSV